MTLLYPGESSDKPDGATYAMDCSDSQYTSREYVYTNQSQSDFDAYIEKLSTQSGMRQVAHNSLEDAIDAYTYYNEKVGTLYTYYAKADRTIKVIVTDGYDVPQSDSFDQGTATVTPSVAQLGINTANGMSYVFTLSDGSYLIYDGGESASDAALLYDYMGGASKESIVIAGWVITHGHADHYGAFKQFVNSNYSNVTLERVFYNAGAPKYFSDIRVNAGLAALSLTTTNSILTTDLKNLVGADTELVRVHTGQSISVRDAQIDVLYTPEDYCDDYIHTVSNKNVIDVNDFSVVTMVTLGGKKTLIMGDIYLHGATVLKSYYDGTNVLECDILQIPHHGDLGTAEMASFVSVFESMSTLETKLCPTTKSNYTSNYSSITFNKTLCGTFHLTYKYKFQDSTTTITLNS